MKNNLGCKGFSLIVSLLMIPTLGWSAEEDFLEKTADLQRQIDLKRKINELAALSKDTSAPIAIAVAPVDLPKVYSIFSRNGKFSAKLRFSDGIERTLKLGDSISSDMVITEITSDSVRISGHKQKNTVLSFSAPRDDLLMMKNNGSYSSSTGNIPLPALPNFPIQTAPLLMPSTPPVSSAHVVAPTQ